MSNIPVGLSGCDRNGIAGNCGTTNCDTLMSGECEIMDSFAQNWLYEIGLIDEKPAEPKSDADDAYERAMEILL